MCEHDIEERWFHQVGAQYYCSVCEWTWRARPRTECPGLPRFEFSDQHGRWVLWQLFTPRELEAYLGMRPCGPARGCYWSRTWHRFIPLYDIEDCLDRVLPSVAQMIRQDLIRGYYQATGQYPDENVYRDLLSRRDGEAATSLKELHAAHFVSLVWDGTKHCWGGSRSAKLVQGRLF